MGKHYGQTGIRDVLKMKNEGRPYVKSPDFSRLLTLFIFFSNRDRFFAYIKISLLILV